MTPEHRSALDCDNEQLETAIAALPVDVRQAVESMRLAKSLARTLLNMDSASWSESLAEEAAVANAYAFCAWFYNEISEQQWRLLRDYAATRRDLRREQLEARPA